MLMQVDRLPFVRRLALTAVLVATVAVLACDDNEAPVPTPERIAVVSGDDQYSRKGTELEDPVVVEVALSDGSPAVGQLVRFQVVEGGGSLSRTSATVTSNGTTSARWTLGPGTGTQRLLVFVADNTSLSVQVEATSSEYYCPEEDPAFVRKFTPQHDLFLLTRESGLLVSAGEQGAGLVQIHPNFPGQFDAGRFIRFEEDIFLNIVRDCEFSASGDFYVAWTQGVAHHEVIKIAPDGSFTHFATLQSFAGSEITMTPDGNLAGCDEFGPFTVTCRDTLTRYPDALFTGVVPDAANCDAAAADPAAGDLYFIALTDKTLRRVPLDGHDQTGPTETVVSLTSDEASGARGMVVADDGIVYILVESTNTKAIVRVTAAGAKSTAVDFFAERGAGGAAGVQSDLAIDPNFGSGFIYTLDTLNDVILIYEIATGNLSELTPSGNPDDASDITSGERVGLAVMR